MSEPLELTEGQRVTVGGREFVVEWSGCAGATPELAPAPAPLLPWEEHPDAWWQAEGIGGRLTLSHSSNLNKLCRPANWTRVIGAVPADTHVAIPRELIENLRESVALGNSDEHAQAILDAADGAS